MFLLLFVGPSYIEYDSARIILRLCFGIRRRARVESNQTPASSSKGACPTILPRIASARSVGGRPVTVVPASEIIAECAHAVAHTHVVAHAVLMVGESETSCLWQRERLHGHAADLRRPVVALVRRNNRGVCSTLGQVLQDVPHCDRERDTQSERR